MALPPPLSDRRLRRLRHLGPPASPWTQPAHSSHHLTIRPRGHDQERQWKSRTDRQVTPVSSSAPPLKSLTRLQRNHGPWIRAEATCISFAASGKAFMAGTWSDMRRRYALCQGTAEPCPVGRQRSFAVVGLWKRCAVRQPVSIHHPSAAQPQAGNTRPGVSATSPIAPSVRATTCALLPRPDPVEDLHPPADLAVQEGWLLTTLPSRTCTVRSA